MTATPERKAGLLVFAVLAISYAYFFQGGGWNPNSRLDLTRALAAGDGFRIDRFRHNTGDWAHHGGHYYTNKSPGLSVLSLPAFLAAGSLDRSLFSREPASKKLSFAAYATNLTANSLMSALLGLLVFETLRGLALGPPATCAWLALAFGLGTLAFPYSTAYYAHQPSAALSFAAFWLLSGAVERRHGCWRALAAGCAIATAITLELSTLATAAVITAAMLPWPAGRRLCPWFLAGAAPIVAGLGAYHYLCFGSVLATGYSASNPAVMVAEQGHLFGPPKLERLAALALSPHRGLFFSSPMLALALFGFPDLFRTARLLAVVCGLVPVAFLALFSSFHGWEGGWAPGPRYLVPCLPFLFIPAAFAVRRMPKAFVLLAAVSAALMLAITAVAVEIPAGTSNPLRDFIFPWLARGRVSVNPQGLDTYLVPLEYLRLRSADNWNSFNLGEFFFPHSVASLLPLLAIWLAAGLCLRRIGRAGLSPSP